MKPAVILLSAAALLVLHCGSSDPALGGGAGSGARSGEEASGASGHGGTSSVTGSGSGQAGSARSGRSGDAGDAEGGSQSGAAGSDHPSASGRDAGSDAFASSGRSGISGTSGSSGTTGATDAGVSGRVDAGRDASGGATGPCDLYEAANTPCVAAHSTVRALYGSFSGSLYQVRRKSDQTTKDVPVLSPGGYADVAVQDAFCVGTTCTISVIYDQSPYHNDLAKSPKAYWLKEGGNEANAADGKITVNGHTVHGIYVTGYQGNVAYRNNATKGIARDDEPEAMYMVVDGRRYSNQCCFDYGNAETSGNDDGNGTMEAVYWGNDITWGGKGDGNGPWVAADLENGVFKADHGGWQSQSLYTPSAKSVIAPFATAMLKGPSGNHFTLKAGNAQSGGLTTMWDGLRPSPGYSPKKLQGAIILGTGGDGSNGGTGTFFEGAMTKGTPPDSVDSAVQENIVSAGYGR